MKFRELGLSGAFEIMLQPLEDERGSFARRFSADIFAAEGLETDFRQRSVSCNRRKGTLRGLHFQTPPFAETKLVRCTRGSAFDVIVDLRRSSPTCGQWRGLVLSADDDRLIYIPVGFAHGFLTLEDATDIDYEITTHYQPDAANGIRYDDPTIGIDWPGTVECIGARDLELPCFDPSSSPFP